MTEIKNIRNEDSLAPLELDRLTIEEEAAFMNRGKGKQLAATAVVISALVVGGAFVMKELDRKQGELERGQAAADVGRDHVNAYLQCVAPTVAASALTSADKIHGALENVVERKQKASGVTFARCAQPLAGVGKTLSSVAVGPELAPAVAELRRTTTELAKGATALSGYLEDPARAYDFVQATALIDRVARAAAACRERDQALRAKIADR